MIKNTQKQQKLIKNKILLGDAYKIISKLENESFDLIITDPPYGTSIDTGFFSKGLHRFNIYKQQKDWDKLNEENIEFMIENFSRLLKPTGSLYVFCDVWKLGIFIKYAKKYNLRLFRHLAWIKTNPMPINAKLTYLSNAGEDVFYAVNKLKPIFNNCYHNAIFSFPILHGKERIKNKNGLAFHPTQKPVNLIKEFIRNSSNENDLIFDPFVGVGTTAIAAKELKRNYFGIEINKEYYKKAIKRLLDEK